MALKNLSSLRALSFHRAFAFSTLPDRSSRTVPKRNFVATVAMLAALAACGGGGGGGDDDSSSSDEPFPFGVATGPAVTAVIGPAGGTLDSADGKLTISIPAGALALDTTVGIQPFTNTAPGGHGAAYHLTARGASFAVPVQIILPFSAADVQGSTPDALGVGFQDDDGYWWAVTDAVRDDVAQTLSVSTTHLSYWSQLRGWQIAPAEKTIGAGEQAALAVVYCEPEEQPDPGGGDTLVTLLSKCATDDEVKPLVSEWAVDGVQGGRPAIGLVRPVSIAETATYTAPATVIGQQVHAVSARLSTRRRQIQLLVANITVVGQGSYRVTGNFEAHGANAQLMDQCPQIFAVFGSPSIRDTVKFLLIPNQGALAVAEIENTDTVLTFTPVDDLGYTATMDEYPELLTADDWTVISTGTHYNVTISGSGHTGGCTAYDQDGQKINEVSSLFFPSPMVSFAFDFSTDDFVDGSQTVGDPVVAGVSWTITEIK